MQTDRGSQAGHLQRPPSRLGTGGTSPQTRCPHCNSKTRIRETRQIHNTYREVTYQCLNVRCSCSFVAGVEVIRLISPSGTPNPRLMISTKPRDVPPEMFIHEADESEVHLQQTGPPPEPPTLDLPFG